MRTLCKVLVLCAIFGMFLPAARGQAISNSNFHILNPSSPLNVCNSVTDVSPASSFLRIEDMCDSWFTPTKGTPDFYYGCDTWPNGAIDRGVPRNTHYPLTDCNDASDPTGTTTNPMRAYAGIRVIDNPSTALCRRDYISQNLAIALSPGRSYTVSFMMRSSSLASQSRMQRIGCLLTTNSPTFLDTYNGSGNGDGAIDTAIGSYGEVYDASGWDASDWHYVSVNVFVTSATINYLTIGNFQEDIPDAEWISQGSPAAVGSEEGYYMIDNVYICEVCPPGIKVEKKVSSDPTKCCYDITLLDGNVGYCNLATSIKVTTPAGVQTISGPFDPGVPFEFCTDRFTSGLVLFQLYDGNGALICHSAQRLQCDCECDFATPSNFKISLDPAAAGPGSCCWDIVVHNDDGPYPNDYSCDVRARGIKIQLPPMPPGSSFTPAAGYSTRTVGSLTYITKGDTNGGDVYETGTTTSIGTICLPQGTVDFTVSFQVIGSINGTEVTACGANMTSVVSCADECCDQVLNAVLSQISAPNSIPMQCCFRINVMLAMPHPCITSVELQSLGSGWTTAGVFAVGAGSGLIIQSPALCTTPNTSKKVRLLFKNGSKVVCIKEFTLKCEEDCCSKVKSLHAYKELTGTCCYRILGTIDGSNSGCPGIDNFTVDEYNPYLGGWVSLTPSIAPNPDGTFNVLVCLTTGSTTLRITFRNGSTVVCTRWVNVECGITGGKMGANRPFESIDSKAYVVPNPAIDETTIHYTLRQDADVRILVFNNLGDIVANIQAPQLSIGAQSTTISTTELPSGMYFVQISAGGDIITVPLTVVK